MRNSIAILLLLLNLVGFGQTATFSSNFEDQNMDADIGRSVIETSSAGNMYVVPNPHPAGINTSDYVLKLATAPKTGARSEYAIARHETDEKKYIYQWKRYHAPDMLTDVSLSGVLINQWKTWPCEAPPIALSEYEYFDTLICNGGGIFNDMMFYEDGIIRYRSRAIPDCNADYYNMQQGEWVEFTLEIYWTATEEGYYRIWRDNVLFGYSDNMKTLFDGFLEGTCDVFFATGLYGGWSKSGNETTDSLLAYIDDVTLYDIDSGFIINSVCPECELAPSTPTDSNVYKINLQGSSAADGYNNVITYWAGDTSALNLSNTFGQSNGIDLYLWSGANMGTGSSEEDCFSDIVINKYISWGNDETHQIYLKDLNPNNTYALKILASTVNSGTTRGTQIWTTDENRDTVFAVGNTCNMAKLTGLVSDANGNLTINVKPIGGTAYINAIEIIENRVNNINTIKNTKPNELNIFPNPVNDNLFVKGVTVPSSITIYSLDGRKVKYAKNTNTVNISNLRKGIYMVIVNLQESFVTNKIIKE